MSRVLVTGASGFVGRALVTALAARGDAVRAQVRDADIATANRAETVATGNLAEFRDWPVLLAGVDTVIHLAAIAHTGPDIPETDYDRVNRGVTETLAAAAKTAGVSRLMFLSSIRAQCGPTADRVLTEISPAQPSDAYGRSKLAAEAAIRASGVPYTILRPVLIYGPDPKGNLATLARVAALPIPLPLAAMNGRRSLLGLDNLISAILHCLATPATIGGTLIVADREALTLAEIVATLRRARGRRPGLIAVPPGLLEMAFRIIGRHDMWQRMAGRLEASPEKLVGTGWQPGVTTQDGLQAMVHS